jgi:N-acetylneuraminate synthase/N,N'-diacetyllegionaminate synthase
LLDEIGVSCFKIGSGEITNVPLLRQIARKGKPIILSTGMSTLGEVEEALSAIRSISKEKVTVLHCVTEYPAPFEQINLTSMLTLKNAFKVPVGYSDHTPGIEIALAAVALGAEIIEKHFTLDKNMEGPDHKASIDPGEFREMVRAIRHIESALGDGIKRPAECEIPNMTVARKSLHVAKPLRQGSIIREEDLVMKRPGTGLDYRFIEFFLGKKAKRDLEEDTRINFSDVE